jgi:hypothetical protein
VLPQHPLARRLADRPRARRRQVFHVARDVAAVCRDEHLHARLEEEVDPLPPIGDQACTCTCGLEDTRRG